MDRLFFLAASGVAMGLLATAATGCSRGGECEYQRNCADGPSNGTAGQAGTGGAGAQGGTAGTGAQGGAGGAAGSAGQGGAGGMEPAHCGNDPTVKESVAEDCGVFVAGDTTGAMRDGTKANPFKTLSEAVAFIAEKGKPRRIFACGGMGTAVNETATVVMSGYHLIGGFAACDGKAMSKDWTWAEGNMNTDIKGPANVILRFDGGNNSLEHVDVEAPKSDVPGESSIAVIVNGVSGETSFTMRNGKLKTGDTVEGAPGEALDPDSSLDGKPGNAGLAPCDGGIMHAGGAAVMSMCPDGQVSMSGMGGTGTLPGTNAGAGEDGMPASASGGKGGKGEDMTACMNGTNGAPGDAGGLGAGAGEEGKLTEKGYEAVHGSPGSPGKPGQGGGGGGGSKGANMVACPGGQILNVLGASGGSGGSGGCGGRGGNGGQSAGSSMPLILLGDTVTTTFSAVTIDPGKTGAGGKGNAGQLGGQPGGLGLGGAAASPAKKACNGGEGGLGGTGGSGGGGRGGHIIGIAYTGTKAPSLLGVSLMMPMEMPGAGGDGGPGNEMAGKGAAGIKAETYQFP